MLLLPTDREERMRQVRISSEPDGDPADRQTLQDAIDRFNVRVTGLDEGHFVSLYVRDEKGRLLGGLTGEVWAGWLHVKVLWLDESLRRQGLGSRLLAQAEEQARAHGCKGVFLETFSFQAPDFYRRHGYQVFGRVEEYPGEHSQFLLKKRLDRPGEDRR
jgi:ribosomal protein S18 acetylase RimI-like enzyme